MRDIGSQRYEVHGIKRRSSTFNTQRIDHIYEDPHKSGQRLKLRYGDLSDSSNLTRIIQETQPDEIYNLGAQSHVAVSFESPEYTADVDALGALRLLDAIRFLGLEKKTKFYQASTSELYGPGDNYYDLNNSHVLPALIRKAHEAKQRGDTALPVWGSGRARREFLYVDDLATACVYFMHKSLAEHAPSGASANTATGGQPLPLINIGSGSDLTIAELAQTVMQVIGFSGQLSFDTSKPDGTPQKLSM